jgi:hypothetical protein
MQTITEAQFDKLLGFKLHIWNHYHQDVKTDFGFWADLLDEAKIPWFVQNTVSILMENRANGFSSLRALLKGENILIV